MFSEPASRPRMEVQVIDMRMEGTGGPSVCVTRGSVFVEGVCWWERLGDRDGCPVPTVASGGRGAEWSTYTKRISLNSETGMRSSRGLAGREES